ncbi:MAG: SpoIIE family protein phosphatase [Candidatus Eremiobacteraeota bacterium]|nr:SpoIIE family protein phosphatase [Candidatus Eremiobacteraeota bacterium]MBV8366541.1 SpoIIE family protein phosphatase [Candidatus Eremiobacteraeota bacterium]
MPPSDRTPTRVERPPGPVTAGAVLLVALIVSITGSYITYRSVQSAFSEHEAYDNARALLQQCEEDQLNEETGVRGFLSTGSKIFLEPYYGSETSYAQSFAQLTQAVNALKLSGAPALMLDLRSEHALWLRQIAQPLIASPYGPNSVNLLERGKLLMDRMRNDYARLNSMIGGEANVLFNKSTVLLRNMAGAMAAVLLLFGVAALVADLYRGRTQEALARERAMTDTLQRAFLSGWDLLPYLRVGTAYVSSTREAAVGGDLFDVYRLDDHRALIMVADVSGKGLSAAVDTAQVKYSIRTLAETEEDPALIVDRFNEIYERSAREAEAFVSLFIGIIDDRDLSFYYASAGHGSVFARSGSRVWPLISTGPVIGLGRGLTFDSARVQMGVGDVLVLATDGLTEARDQAGLMLGEEQAMRWIERGNADPQRLADELVANLRRYAGGRIADDLALLVIRIQRAPVMAEAAGLPRPRREVAPQAADSGLL